MIRRLLLVTLALNALALSQTSTTPVRRPAPDLSTGVFSSAEMQAMEHLRDEAMADHYAFDELRHLTDNIGPRISGSAQAAQAVEYVAGEMKALGAEVRLERTSVPHWVRGIETGELLKWVGQAPGTTQKIVLTALGGSVATPSDGMTAPVVVVNSFRELRGLPPDSIKGKILLFNERFDKRLAAEGFGGEAYGEAVVYRGHGPSIGARAGAIAVLVRSVGGADYRVPHTGALEYLPDSPKVPAAAVTAEDADLIADLAKQGEVQIHLTLTPQILPPAESFNVIADWPGSEAKNEIVIVSGHLDSWDLGTGAIDDGAGVAVAMQALHLMHKLNLHPRRTVRFIAWMDEEQSGSGSATYAREAGPGFPHHVAAIESDLGAGHPAGITYLGSGELDKWLTPISGVLSPIGATTRSSTGDTGEDISPLVAAHVPTFTPTQDSRFYFNYHHTPADTLDKVDPRELNENAAVMAVLAYALADSAQPAPR